MNIFKVIEHREIITETEIIAKTAGEAIEFYRNPKQFYQRIHNQKTVVDNSELASKFKEEYKK